MIYLPLKRKPGHVINFKYAHPFGVKTQQTPEALPLFEQFLVEESFDRIIELGTHKGGFALFLSSLADTNVYTFDVQDFLTKEVKKQLIANGCSFYKEDVFSSSKVRELITSPGRVLLLCDNGNKPKEINTFGAFLKVDDIVMVHDYFKDADTYYRNNKWKSCEIIEESIEDKSLELIEPHSSDFEKVFWACRRKAL